MSENKIKSITMEWLKKAQDDELAIQAILKEKVSFATACFLAQQLGEKCLKAFLAENELRIPKIHQLERLLGICKEVSDDFSELNEDAILLSEYYIESRYPGDYPENISNVEADEARESALRIKRFVYKQLNFSL